MIINVERAEKLTTKAGDKSYLNVVSREGKRYSIWSDAEDVWGLFLPGESVDLEAHGLFVRSKGIYNNIVKELKKPAAFGPREPKHDDEMIRLLKNIAGDISDIKHNMLLWLERNDPN